MRSPSDYPTPTGSASDLLSALHWRYAVKRFDPERQIATELWSAIEASLVLTPSSFGLQPWRFVIVTDPEIKAQLPAFSWGQQQPKDCSHMVIIATLKAMDQEYVERFLQSVSQTRGTPIESLEGYKKVILGFLKNQGERVADWAKLQGYIALGQLMTSAAFLGVDACPMEGIEPDKYDRLLGLEHSAYATRVACALGYRHPEDGYSGNAKVRFSAESVTQRL